MCERRLTRRPWLLNDGVVLVLGILLCAVALLLTVGPIFSAQWRGEGGWAWIVAAVLLDRSRESATTWGVTVSEPLRGDRAALSPNRASNRVRPAANGQRQMSALVSTPF